jgi:hypothetical protein
VKRLPKYYRPPKRKTCLGLNDEAKTYIRSQALIHAVTMTFWLNMFLVHASRKGRNFDPTPFVPTPEELKALAVSGLSAKEVARYKVTNFGSVRRPHMPKKPKKQGKF